MMRGGERGGVGGLSRLAVAAVVAVVATTTATVVVSVVMPLGAHDADQTHERAAALRTHPQRLLGVVWAAATVVVAASSNLPCNVSQAAGMLPTTTGNTTTTATDDYRSLLVEGLGPPVSHRHFRLLRGWGSLTTADARWHVKPRYPLVRERRDSTAFAALDGQLAQPVTKDEGEEALAAVHVRALEQARVRVEIQAERAVETLVKSSRSFSGHGLLKDYYDFCH